LSSSFAAAEYLKQHPMQDGQLAYVIGQHGICEELALAGIPHIGGPDDKDKVADMSTDGIVEHDTRIGAVVVGFDPYINFYKIQYAQLCINENPGCRFIATNLDATAHLTHAQEWAEAGAMVGAIRGCTGVEPILVGKPSSLLIDHIVATSGADRSRMCMVGDRLDTDVLFGQRNGLQTVLTLSGVTTHTTLHSEKNTTVPDYYVDSIRDFFPHAVDATEPVE
jgi:phosphoglycolate/pyridoxal phosphate phosphatase family enzyme